jgi:subtilisin family serine protease
LNPDTQSTVIFRTALGGGDPGDVSAQEHGTTMAMFAAAPANGWGMIGAAPAAVRIISVRVAQPAETGEGLDYYPAGIRECLHYRQTYNIKVISLSLGSAPPETTPQSTIDEQVTIAHNYGIDVVAAAGNDQGPLEYPAADPTVLSVGATGTAHELCGFSSVGARLLAPGCELDAADPNTGWPNSDYSQGTSQAAAITAAVLGALRAYRPELTPEEAEQLLTSQATGTLNVTATFQAAGLTSIIQAGTQTELPAPLRNPPATQDINPTAPPTMPPPTGPPLTARLPRPHARLRRHGKHLLLSLTSRPVGAETQLLLLGRHHGHNELGRLRMITSSRAAIQLPAQNVLAVRVRYIDPYDTGRASAWTRLPLPSSTT